jgi:diguanylate cyclase (GGDEF)-like protein/PAS domain S-box-containing protein
VGPTGERANRLLRMQEQVAAHLAEGTSAAEVLARVLATVGETLDCTAGAVWQPVGDHLRCSAAWTRSGEDDPFVRDARRRRIGRGEGVPGTVWEQGEPIWAPELSHEPRFLRGPVAEAAGLRSAIVFPMRVGGAPAGVIEVFDGRVRPPEPDVMAGLLTIGAQVAQFLDRARAHASLAGAEARYRTLVEQMPMIVYVAEWTPAAPFIYVSPQVEEVLGFAPEAFLAHQDLWYERVHPEDLERVVAEERRTFETEGDFDCEYRMIAADGRVVWLHERDAIIRDGAGQPRFSQGVLVDVTERKAAERAVLEERDRAQRYLDVAGAMIVVVGADERVRLINKRGCEVHGYEEGEVVGRNWFDLFAPGEEREGRRASFRAVMAGTAELDVHEETHVLTREGERRILSWRNTLLRDESGAVVGMLSSGEDVTEQRAAEREIAHLAYHDPLTDLPNRALLEEHLELALARARRDGHSVALLYVDLDDFKLVNDSLGHAAGDELLRRVAERLGSTTRETDLLARQGGDEFLLLVTDLAGNAQARAESIAAQVTDALSEPFTLAGTEFQVGASIGISLFPRDAGDADALLKHADAAMYQAKRLARSSFSLYAGHSRDPIERLSLTNRLRKALARDELELHYQPIHALPGGQLAGLEALLRWRDPQRGLVLPGEFIAVAEDTGLIEPIGEWVLEALCRQLASWQDIGLEPAVSMNVSPRQLRGADFAAGVGGRIAAHSLDPGQLTIEITESTAMSEPHQVEQILHELHDLGLRVAIDDFGAGFSSLARLRQLPVDELKIDRSFLRDVPAHTEATAIVSAILALAGALGMAAVAEGVETEEQLRFLVACGAPLAQGFHLGRAMPVDETTSMLLAARSLQDAPVALR